jgi:transcriptional regulator with XRE-family HTH domain
MPDPGEAKNKQDRAADALTTLGKRITARRQAKGFTLSQLADIAKVSKGYVSELESDQAAKPSAEVLYNIADALDTTVGYLLGRRRNPLIDAHDGTELVIPPALEEFARQDRIPDEDKRRLACIEYRGKQPKTAADWRYLYDTLKRMV